MFYEKKIVIAGGSGFIGQAMAQRWAADNEVIILSRSLSNSSNNAYGDDQSANVQYLEWDARSAGSWAAARRLGRTC